MLKKYRPNDSEPEHSSVEIPSNGRTGRAATVSDENDEDDNERYERGQLFVVSRGVAVRELTDRRR